jgi:hypothetical protein
MRMGVFDEPSQRGMRIAEWKIKRFGPQSAIYKLCVSI